MLHPEGYAQLNPADLIYYFYGFYTLYLLEQYHVIELAVTDETHRPHQG